jgi:signal transduction histidine kinase
VNVKGGLTRRTIVASALLAVLVGGAFAVLVRAIAEERDSAALATRSQQAIAAADRLEGLVLDLETGQRGYLITRQPRFLAPWRTARAEYRPTSEQLIAASNGAARQARGIAAAVDSYVQDYSVPLVTAAQRGDPAARSSAALDRGKRRVDEIRGMFDRFMATERQIFATREKHADDDARQAVFIATGGLVGSMLLIVLFGGYLTRAVALPVRRAAEMAGRLADGELSTRMPETGTGEVRTLEHSFNTMAASLETSRDELRVLADEQAALRRVATLVARAVPPDEVFDAVAAELHSLLGSDATQLIRRHEDGTVSTVAGRMAAGLELPKVERLALDEHALVSQVLRTGRPGRIESYEGRPGAIATLLRGQGIRSSAGAPIIVDDRVWGAIVAWWRHDQPALPTTAQRLAQFTELVATAIANAESRSELAASRARVVATADETRRRIERDLHDGAQQRLVHAVITLKLAQRELGDADGPVGEMLEEALDHAERAMAELRDLAHGILPAALTRGGLKAGVQTLLSRIRIPVAVDVTDERLPPTLEATAYFIVAEALTNTVKYAQADRAEVTARVQDGVLRVEVRDDGIGGVRTDGSSGLLGLHDRAAALNGELRIDSPPGAGTAVVATLPIPAPGLPPGD